MSLFSNKKILVIGSFGHPLADKCIGWSEIKSLKYPYLGDYHLLIINLQSLNESDLDKKMKKAFEKIRKEINEIIWANTEIICITAPTIIKGEISNYDWCPTRLNFIKQEGENFEEEPREGYFQFVKKWNHFFEKYSDIEDLKSYILQKRKELLPQIHPLLKNLAKKYLGFKLIFGEFDEIRIDSYTGKKIPKNLVFSKPIYFFPPTTEISIEEAIDYLLKEERGVVEAKKTKLPKWTENVMVYGEEDLRKKIKEKEELKKKCEKELEENNKKLLELFKFKRLLTADGKELENIVEEAFQRLGINIKMGPKGKEDRIIIDPLTNSEIPIEITGVKHSIPEWKLNQLIGNLTDEERIKKIKCKCKGVLVGNHYKEEPLDSNLQGRKNPFEPDVIKKAKISKISLLSTIELFKAVNTKKEGKNLKLFINKLFNKPGEIKFKINEA